jgi:hypothetical protein
MLSSSLSMTGHFHLIHMVVDSMRPTFHLIHMVVDSMRPTALHLVMVNSFAKVI